MSEGYAASESGLKGRRTLIYLALSLMTASWITGLLAGFFVADGPAAPLTVLVLTLLTLLSLAFGRALRRLELRQELRRGILAGAFAFLCLLVLSSGFYNRFGLFGGEWLGELLRSEQTRATFLNQITSLVLVAACGWLGLLLGDMRLTSANLSRYFYVCILLLVLPAIFFVSDISQDLPWLYFLFLFAALLALGLGRVEEAARRSQDQGSPFTLYWLAQLGLTAAVLLGVVGVAHALNLAHGLGLVIVLVAPVITVLFFPFVYVGAKLLILSGLRWAAPAASGEPSAEAEVAAQASEAAQPSTLQSLCVGLALLILVLLIVRLFLFTTRRWREMAEDWRQEEQAATPSLGERISEAMEERLMRSSLQLPGLNYLRRRLVTRSIRRIYAALVALGAERGHPRPAARTPYEHLPELRRAFPGCEAQIAQITDAYIAAHYGQVPETRAALQGIRASWEHVREVARSTPSMPLTGTSGAREGGRV